MRWYATVVFPLVVKMPTLEELDNNGAEYKSAGFNGATLSVDCVHTRLWNVSANLKQVFIYKVHNISAYIYVYIYIFDLYFYT
jgi:hypothetical protein